ncbi:MAG TPA: FAD:protein FMN transferase [Mesotoga infera]|uniref:FAD:protein FMN transferase n=1 Tax=Mesotoga infera TaxID=1236046 RepID=A0A7C1CSL8_9BACT|nr:FAD:protein FMN transferase [Mesotoga infera]
MPRRNPSHLLRSRTIVYAVLLVSAVVLLILIFFRQKPLEYYDRTEYLLGTYVTVRVSSSKMSPVTLAEAAIAEIERIDEKFGSRRDGMIAELNRSGELQNIDKETSFLIKSALEIAKNTSGAFDPTLYELTKLWGFDDESSEKRIPSEKEIEEALASTGFSRITFAEESEYVSLADGATLDLGAIAKGYAVDMAIAKIKALDKGATGFIDAGGDIGVIGPKYGSRPWIVGVRDPRGESVQDVIEYIYLYDGAVATSGDYERFFVEDNVRYHHILDPETGYPSRNGVISATVIGRSAMLADAYATAAFVIGMEPGVTFLPRFGALVFLVMEDMSTFKSPGFEVYQER